MPLLAILKNSMLAIQNASPAITPTKNNASLILTDIYSNWNELGQNKKRRGNRCYQNIRYCSLDQSSHTPARTECLQTVSFVTSFTIGKVRETVHNR